jgi:hypothetical protein
LGLQRLLLDGGRLARLPDGAWCWSTQSTPTAWRGRRVDHDNIDVNRNFIDFDQPPQLTTSTPEIDPIMN